MEIPDRLKGTWWDEPLSMEELEAITPLTADRTRAFELTPFEMVQLNLLFIGNDNTIILPPSATEGPRRQVLDDNSDAIKSAIQQVSRQSINHPTIDSIPSFGNLNAALMHQRRGLATATLSGGSLANVPLVPAVAGVRAVIEPYALFGDTTDEYTLSFEDEDDAGLFPATAIPIAVDIKHPNEVSPIMQTHGVAGDNSGAPPASPHFYTQAVNKAIEVDIAGGTGTENLAIWFLFNYEVIA